MRARVWVQLTASKQLSQGPNAALHISLMQRILEAQNDGGGGAGARPDRMSGTFG